MRRAVVVLARLTNYESADPSEVRYLRSLLPLSSDSLADDEVACAVIQKLLEDRRRHIAFTATGSQSVSIVEFETSVR